MFNKPLQQKYGRQRKLNYRYTSIPSIQYSAWRKGIHWRTVVTSRVGQVLSIQFGDNHVVGSEANYYYS